jgi:prevent-host-death family protein
MAQTRHSNTWTFSEARARLSAVIDRALVAGPQTIPRRGRSDVVLTAVESRNPRQPREGTLAEFFANSPLRGSGIDLERVHDWPREISFGDVDVGDDE